MRDASTVEFLRGTGRIAMAYSGFTSFRLPMNSMGAFHEAAKLGFRYIETDVRATRDGVAVTLHDRKLGPESGVPGAIDQLSWLDVRKANLCAGESIPALKELLSALPDMRINIAISNTHRPSSRPSTSSNERKHTTVASCCQTGAGSAEHCSWASLNLARPWLSQVL
jgi:glycerophosphoryl diester phosphodiesterase